MSGHRHNTPARREKSFAPTASVRQIAWAGFKFLVARREKSFTANRVQAEIFARERFARLLRAPFPDQADKQIAAHWAPHLGVSERSVENWLACTHSASITEMTIVGATHGVFQTAAIFVGEDRRDEILQRIGR